ncbi:signal peptidase I [Idiomarina tyrosinivorans]|uniref:Signal peptidase I n=1 Tax=Idiomarina tyrosinivorans TaxID=1445662 RepID=A0A432ZRQ5_9GAMM|nr:signal peptidase I [Idiomarina tyrosinivorans]RUO80594.1 signal peptidase I [Idiomarina tyrosinivorans]
MANYFSIILTLVTLATGVIWALEKWLWAPKREAGMAQPWVNEFSQSVFPVLFVVLVLRSFLYEPFRIPSGSMMPTLLEGDFILVEKYAYGIKDPLVQSKLIDTGSPQRGDIAVFKYPLDPSVDYIKRIIGLPGDRIIYRNKTLYVQPACDQQAQQECPKMQVIASQPTEGKQYFTGASALDTYQEQLFGVSHKILKDPRVAPRIPYYFNQPGTQQDEWIVPEGHYFAMGDNRDNSVDSRYWGFVPDENLVGQAVFIWMSFDMDRDASSWLPQWVPTGIRWSRLGGVQ